MTPRFTPERPLAAAQMSLAARAQLLALTAAAIVELGLLAATLVAPSSASAAMPDLLIGLVAIAGIGTLFVALVVYGALVEHEPRLGSRARSAWALALALAPPIAMPLYFGLYVWTAPLVRRG